MTPEEKRVLNAIGQIGGSLATVKGLRDMLGMDLVELKRQIHRLLGSGYIKAHGGGTVGVICYSLTVDGNAELLRDVA